jgi:hypothetical protein
VSQISPPIRIVLVAAVALIGVWMLFLRPKTPTPTAKPSAPATAPGVKGLTNDVAKAKAAAATQEASDAKVQSATGEESVAGTKSGAATPGAKGAAAKPAAGDTAGLPVRVQKALDHHKVLVIGFFNPKSADDRAVRRAVGKVDRWEGQVVVQKASVNSVARYSKIARGADVTQSPTVVVVDRNAKAERLVGFQDTRSIDQAVVDAMRASGILIRDPYLRKLNDVCRVSGGAVFNVPEPTQAGAELRTSMHRLDNRMGRAVADIKALPAPGKWRAFKRANVADLKVAQSWVHGLAAATGNGTHLAPILTYFRSSDTKAYGKAGKSFNARMDKHHVLSCGSNF